MCGAVKVMRVYAHVCVRVCVHGMCAVRMRALCEGWMMSGRYSCMRGNNCVVWVR